MKPYIIVGIQRVYQTRYDMLRRVVLHIAKTRCKIDLSRNDFANLCGERFTKMCDYAVFNRNVYYLYAVQRSAITALSAFLGKKQRFVQNHGAAVFCFFDRAHLRGKLRGIGCRIVQLFGFERITNHTVLPVFGRSKLHIRLS